MKTPVSKFDDIELVTEHNALVHSRQTFSLIQQRILAFAIARIKRSDNGDEVYEIRIKDLIGSGTSSSIYQTLEDETRDLVSKIITDRRATKEGKNSFKHLSVVSMAEHVEGSGVLRIRFDPDIRSYLFNLNEGNFSSAVAVEIASCKSLYGARIYRLLVSFWRFGEWRVSVEDLRYKLGIDKKYKNYSHFRKRVLEMAQSDLRNHTSMDFTWKELKENKGAGSGKKITHILFKFTWNPGQLKLRFSDKPTKEISDYRVPTCNLTFQLSGIVGLATSEKIEVLKWLNDKPAQDKPMSKWIYDNLQGTHPVDSAGKIIRSKSKFFMAHFETFKARGYPDTPVSNNPKKYFLPLID